MAEDIKFIEFTEVPGAPKLAVPADFTQTQIDDYLKSDKVENAMFEKGFRFKYGLQPVDMLEEQNLDDGSFVSSWKAGWDSVYAIGQGALANFYDFVGAEERQQEALKAAEQYLLDRNAHIFQRTEEGVLLPRPNTIEDILDSEEQMTAFMKYLKHTSGNAAATSIPIMLTAVAGAAAGTVGGALTGGPVGAMAGFKYGAYGGAGIGAYIFGMGDTYLAQREAGAVDPNAALSMALGVPYAAVEMLGIGGVIPKALAKTFGSKAVAKRVMQKEVMQEIKNKPKSKLIKSVPGLYAKQTLATMMGEAFAETVQETLNRTAEGNVIGFDNLYNDKEFIKQLGEAAAAGFFGGFGFGLINPTIDTVKMLGSGTGPVLKGAAGVADLDKRFDNPIFKDTNFKVGDTVTVGNLMLPDIDNTDTPLFGKKPKFQVAGSVVFDGQPQIVLQSPDIPTGVAFIPIKNIGLINLEHEMPRPSAGDEELNYNYENDEKIATPDNPLNSKEEYSNAKKSFAQTGHIENADDKTVTNFLGGREQIIKETVDDIQIYRDDFSNTIKNITAEERTQIEKDGMSPKQIPAPLEAIYKKYDKLDGEALRQAVEKDFIFWRNYKLLNSPPIGADTNALTEKDREELKKLGYQEGPLGDAYVDKLVNDIVPTKKGRSTKGRDALNNIIKKGIPFSSVSMYQGGPYSERIIVGEKEIVKEPLTDEEKASMVGEGFVFYEDNGKLVPIISPLADLNNLENLSEDELYKIPVASRIRMALELADKLDYRGLQTRYITYYNDARKSLRNKINAAVSQFGAMSTEAKMAREELKTFNTRGDHIVVQSKRPGDPDNVFRLFQILSPTAIRTAENLIEKNQRDSSWASTDPGVRGPLVSENAAYAALVASAYRTRKQLNALLTSLSIEPILDWETFTYQKAKSATTKVRKLYNQQETLVTRRPIRKTVDRLQKRVRVNEGDSLDNLADVTRYFSQPPINLSVAENFPLIIESMRLMLDKMGLSAVDLAITKDILVNAEMEHNQVAAGLTAKTVPDLFKNLPYGLIMVSFDQATFNRVNESIALNNWSSPEQKSVMLQFRNEIIANAVNTLHHEAIHQLKMMGLFTPKEWTMLERQADKWIQEMKNDPVEKNRIDIQKLYPGLDVSASERLRIQREEAIAFKFGEYAVSRRSPNNKSILNLFTRIKSFLMALVNGFRGAGFMTPESIFNHIEAGLVGQRIKTQNETMDIYTSKNIDQMMLQNPRGDIVLSHHFMNTPETRQMQLAYLELMLGDKLMRKPIMDALKEAGYTKGVPEVTSLRVRENAQGIINMIDRQGNVIAVPPLYTMEGQIFMLNWFKEKANVDELRLNRFLETGKIFKYPLYKDGKKGFNIKDIDVAASAELTINDPQLHQLNQVYVNILQEYNRDTAQDWSLADGQSETVALIDYSNIMAPHVQKLLNDLNVPDDLIIPFLKTADAISRLTKAAVESRTKVQNQEASVKRQAMDFQKVIDARVPAGQRQSYQIKFTTTPSKIRWANKFTSKTIPIGNASAIVDEKQALFVHMTPDQYLNLTLPLADKQYDRKALEFMAQAVVDKKEFGVPYLIVELNDQGTIAQVVGQEGRHRVTTAKNINGEHSTVPVAIQFIHNEQNITKDIARKDPLNKDILNNWLIRGFLEGMDRNVFRKVGAPEDFNLVPPVIRANKVINKLYQSFEQTPQGYNFGNSYISYQGPNAPMEIGSYDQAEVRLNRFDVRQMLNDINKAANENNEIYKPGGTATIDKMSWPRKILGHARALANTNTPFKFLFHNIMNMTEKARSLQQALTFKLHKRFLRIFEDPALKPIMQKAIIIAQMTRPTKLQIDSDGRLTFIAPKDGGAADATVEAGEVVVLEGDAAGAFMDAWEVMRDVQDEELKAEIASSHVPKLLQAIAVLKENMPELPELKTLFNFDGKTQEEVSALLEGLNYQQLKFIKDSLSQIMAQIAMKQLYTEGDPSFIGPPGGLEMGVMMEINNILGDKTTGLNALVDMAGRIETRKSWPYIPLMRFGNYYVIVKDRETGDTLWDEFFESRGEALEGRQKLLSKFTGGNAIISEVKENTIDDIRKRITSVTKPLSLEYLAQYVDNKNSQQYAEIVKELREDLRTRKMDRQIIGMDQFFEERDRSVGMEGVPGYSADFPRSIMQYIMVASNALARNRYISEAQANYSKSIAWGNAHNNKNYTEFVEKYWKYTEDPVQEFASLRRMGFWWYLGGNISSALLQGMSFVQFTGPILSQLGGTKNTVKQLGKSFAWANNMVFHGIVGDRQFQDAFLDFTKLPEGTENLEMKEALERAIGDGTIKQGQAFQEAGMVPSMTDRAIGPRGRRKAAFRFFENVIIGGTFNTWEASSRIVAFMTTYNLAKNDPTVLDKADILYGNDQNYQMQMKQWGRGPEALARFMTSETFGVYGKENRQMLGRGFGSLPALFMTYMTQMLGLMYRMLNPPIIKKNPIGRGYRIEVMDTSKTKAQNAMGRKAFARIMLMMLITGGVFGLPGGEDAEDAYDIIKKTITGVESDVRTEFRNMLYEAGWGPGMIESLEKGLVSSFLNMDVQRRVGFGMVPWSQQTRALLNIMGINTGARAEQFLGAPGSVFSDMARGLLEQGVREGNMGKAIQMMSPTFARNIMKAIEYSPLGNGYASTGNGTVLTHDISALDIFWQSIGFTPAQIAKEREAFYQEGKLDKAVNVKRQRINAKITNAYRDMYVGGLNHNGELINEAQQKLGDIFLELAEYNSRQPAHLQFFPDIRRLRNEALAAVYPQYRIMRKNKDMAAEKIKLRLALGLD